MTRKRNAHANSILFSVRVGCTTSTCPSVTCTGHRIQPWMGFGAALVDISLKYKLQHYGWIHLHPTFSAFLSSVDLHTHISLQKFDAASVAIVIDKDEFAHGFRLTELGMKTVGACEKTGFHVHLGEHEDRNLFEDYQFELIANKQDDNVTVLHEKSLPDPGSNDLVDENMKTGGGRLL